MSPYLGLGPAVALLEEVSPSLFSGGWLSWRFCWLLANFLDIVHQHYMPSSPRYCCTPTIAISYDAASQCPGHHLCHQLHYSSQHTYILLDTSRLSSHTYMHAIHHNMDYMPTLHGGCSCTEQSTIDTINHPHGGCSCTEQSTIDTISPSSTYLRLISVACYPTTL